MVKSPRKSTAGPFFLHGIMRGHTDGVTAIAFPKDNSNTIVTSSRDKSLIVWKLTNTGGGYVVVPHKRLRGHTHFVQDVVLSKDGKHALSGSWDKELRSWNLETGAPLLCFKGHSSHVLSVALSSNDNLIASASRDKTIKLWTHSCQCRYTIQGEGVGHSDWVSSILFIPNASQPTIVSGSFDSTVKVWNLGENDFKLSASLVGHAEHVNTVAVSHDSRLCASGGKDGIVLLWEWANGKRWGSLDTHSIIHALCFRPMSPWICAATVKGIMIWDLNTAGLIANLVVDLKLERKMAGGGAATQPNAVKTKMAGGGAATQPNAVKTKMAGGGAATQPNAVKTEDIYCTSICWSKDGSTLFSGYTDGVVRVWGFGGHTNGVWSVDGSTLC